MTDTGATGSRRQRKEWSALASRFREVAANVKAKCECPSDPCAAWAERRQVRDEWEAPEAENDCGASCGAGTPEGRPYPTSSLEACQMQPQAFPGAVPHNLNSGGGAAP